MASSSPLNGTGNVQAQPEEPAKAQEAVKPGPLTPDTREQTFTADRKFGTAGMRIKQWFEPMMKDVKAWQAETQGALKPDVVKKRLPLFFTIPARAALLSLGGAIIGLCYLVTPSGTSVNTGFNDNTSIYKGNDGKYYSNDEVQYGKVIRTDITVGIPLTSLERRKLLAESLANFQHGKALFKYGDDEVAQISFIAHCFLFITGIYPAIGIGSFIAWGCASLAGHADSWETVKHGIIPGRILNLYNEDNAALGIGEARSAKEVLDSYQSPSALRALYGDEQIRQLANAKIEHQSTIEYARDTLKNKQLADYLDRIQKEKPTENR